MNPEPLTPEEIRAILVECKIDPSYKAPLLAFIDRKLADGEILTAEVFNREVDNLRRLVHGDD